MTDEDVLATYRKLYVEYAVNDVENTIAARANYLVALGLLSYLEQLGGIITGDGNLIGKATGNFKAVMTMLGEINAEYLTLDQNLKITDGSNKVQRGVYSVIRCGLVHEYGPKGSVTVMNNPDGFTEGHIGFRVLNEGGVKRLIVHNNELFRDFKALVQLLEQRIATNAAGALDRARQVFERAEAYVLL